MSKPTTSTATGAARRRARATRSQIADVRERRFVADRDELVHVREFVREAIDQRAVEATFADFVATEFATNAIIHAQSDFVVRVGFTPSLLRIEVADDSDSPPMVGRHQPAIHGLEMVDRLVPDWGYAANEGGGKTVWAEVPLRSSD
jgi:anti-sigma regulatory factor (Ser/Thr protein kinase)